MVTNKTRYIGIECCRIIAMLMICNLHVLGIGGVLDKVGNQKDIYYFLANILEAFSYPAVNIFILISGYVGLYSQFSYKKMSKFWLQIIFYTISITLTFAVFSKLSATPTEWLVLVYELLFWLYINSTIIKSGNFNNVERIITFVINRRIYIFLYYSNNFQTRFIRNMERL